MKKELSRESRIVRTSWLGIGANVLLAAFKAGVGLLANSIAILLDAVNNLSDALSSVITIVATKLANRPPDRKHPFGYGRIEYFSAIIIAFIVLFAGIGSLEVSVKKIISPEPADYSTLTILIVAVAVAVKFLLGRYVKRVGEEVDSDALIASRADASFDSIISFATLVSALVMIFFRVSIDAWLGVVISLVIIKAGIEMVMSPVNELLGGRLDAELSKAIKAEAKSIDGVMGAYDLVIHDYGPGQPTVGSMHIELSDRLTAIEIQRICKKVQRVIIEKHNVFLTIGIYAVNTTDPEAVAMRKEIEKEISKYPDILQAHGMYIDPQERFIQFDIVVCFETDNPMALQESLIEKLKSHYPDYNININIDKDISD